MLAGWPPKTRMEMDVRVGKRLGEIFFSLSSSSSCELESHLYFLAPFRR